MHSHLTRSKIAKNNEFYTQYADVATEIEHYLQATPELFRDKCVYLPADCALYAHSAFYRYFKANFTRFGLRKLIAVGYNALTDECGAKRGFCYTLERQVLSNAPNGTSRDEGGVTSENTQRVGESLASARLCRGEACLARRIDVEYNRNTCAPHTTGEACLAPTIAPWARTRDVREAIVVRFTEQARALEGDGDFRSEECRPFWQEADFIITNPPFSLLSHFIELLVAYNKRYLFVGSYLTMAHKLPFQQIFLGKMWFGAERISTFLTPQGALCTINAQWYTNLYHEVPNKPLPTLRTMAENRALYSSRKDAPNGTSRYDVRGLRYEEEKMSENTQNVGARRASPVNNDNAAAPAIRNSSFVIRNSESAAPTLYKPYDNYEAIEVPRIEYIPSDYYGPMGVPITILPYIIHPQNRYDVRGTKYEAESAATSNFLLPTSYFLLTRRAPRGASA